MDQYVNVERMQKREALKAKAMPLAVFGVRTDTTRPLSYNMNQGVVIFSDENGMQYAMHQTPDTHALMEAAEMSSDESISVPNLNDQSTYDKSVSNNTKDEWRRLYDAVAPKR